jgi:hypothetical protein
VARLFMDLCTPCALVVSPPMVVEGWMAQAKRCAIPTRRVSI